LTTDSASANGSMVEKLGARIPTFPGPVNNVRCFDHVLALGGKSVISPFDIPK
ncbi:hypothetical protein BC629DRAFT_1263880, partial [Irpex lacteus]